MKIKKGFRAMVEEAEAQVDSLPPGQVDQKLHQPAVRLVDLRDIRELKREGRIPDSLHVPRGMLEFWIDPDSPYYMKEFDEAEEIILYCNKGWRSALAALSLKSMGIEKVTHMRGGMEQWQLEFGRIDPPLVRKDS